ncbi:MAG: DUF481 domain-containing protein [Bacteroidetes bacterium]|nr:DUF481 domain-containing protein [Bacteroidota bacterium]
MQSAFRFGFLLLNLCFSAAIAQIVNIESRRIVTDTTGLNGHADLNFLANQSKYRLITLGSEAQIQYKTRKSLVLLLGNINYTQAQNTDYLNDGFLHLRYNLKFHPRIRWELFIQQQYNRMLSLRQRQLAGTGFRFKLFEQKKSRMYLGLLGMYEHEILSTGEPEQHNARGSTYLSWTLSKGKQFSFTGTSYYQPLFRNFADYRLSGQANLMLFVTQKLYVKNTLNFLYDSRPPTGAVNTLYNFMAGLGYLFR